MAEFISSDTNIWIDFNAIGVATMPFKLNCTFIMWNEAVEFEILTPEGLREKLLDAGLQAVRLSAKEFFLADEYGDRYAALSTYDAVALAIAKCRDITLLTGDMRLRKAAAKEGVSVMGTIGLLDRLLADDLVRTDEYREAVRALLDANGGVVRLPENELLERLEKCGVS